MTTLYKFTRQDNTSGFETILTWGRGVSHTAQGVGVQLCSLDVIHAYTHPLLAVLLNPIYGAYENPKLWLCEGEVVADDHGLKVGVKTLTTIEEMPLPVVTTKQHVKFAILCAKQVCRDEKWNVWADTWLSGEDRSHATAAQIAQTARAPMWWAAQVAADVATTPFNRVTVVREVAKVAAQAAWWAMVSGTGFLPLNLTALAEQAIQI